jgi:hypothetical protein
VPRRRWTLRAAASVSGLGWRIVVLLVSLAARLM